jgi:hypothetical protein
MTARSMDSRGATDDLCLATEGFNDLLRTKRLTFSDLPHGTHWSAHNPVHDYFGH